MDLGSKQDFPRKAVLLLVDEKASDDASAGGGRVEKLRERWILIAVVAFVFGATAAVYSLVAPKWYRAQTIVSPVSHESNPSLLGSMQGQLGGLAALAGLNVGGEAEKKEMLARLSSREFTYQFLLDEHLIPVLFAGRARKPTLEAAFRYFDEKVRTISEDRRNGLIKITVDWTSPKLAAEWANKLVERANSEIRNVNRAEGAKNLEFLDRELERTNVIEIRQAINRLIESETRKLMLVNVQEQYAFKVVDPAFVPGIEAVVKPRIALLTAAGLLLGATLGSLLALQLPARGKRES